jgi:serine/threonine-protein kinase
MSDNKFERFGKYLILDHLVDGGMAKICRARFLGEQANKIVAIKMVQPQYSKDPSFVQMFEDEINVTFGLLHPNIIQMFDYGMVNDQLFTAMEYVHGADLKQYLDRLKEKKCVFPEEISVYIISQVCQGLHYAHTFTDKLTGKPYNIIHRDISPHNIMLTYDGSVKVIDFGIAKADSNSEATQAGTIKGKLSYLAPEYLDGLELDSRYDIFAVGITLWEMLTGRKLFTASNDLAVLKQIQACKIPPPSKFNPHVPKELDKIILKALSKDRNGRYEDMDKFNRALVKFLYQNYPDFNATDLNSFAEQLFDKEIAEDRVKFVDYGKIDIAPFLSDLKNDNEGGGSSGAGPSLPGSKANTRKIEIDFGSADSTDDGGLTLELGNSTSTGVRVSKSGTTKKKVRKVGGTSAKRRTGSRVSSTKTVRRSSTQTRKGRTSSSKASNRRKASSSSSGGTFKFGAIVAAAVVGIIYFQPNMVKELTGVSVPGASREIAKVEDSKSHSNMKANNVEESRFGIISFSNYDTDMEVLINGQRVNLEGIDAKVPLNKQLSIVIRKAGFKKYVSNNIRLTSSANETRIVIPSLEEERIGLLTTSRNFTSGSRIEFVVDGQRVVRDLPINNYRVPAGSYEGIIANPLLGTERKIKFIIEENKKLFLE